MVSRRLVLAVVLAVGLVAGLVAALQAPAQAVVPSLESAGGIASPAYVLCVNPGGTGGCYSSIQAAVDDAQPGDEIWVATGTYTDLDARPAPAGYRGSAIITQVVYVAKPVTLRGGYNAYFSAWDPLAYPTTLDAGGQGRAAFVYGEVAPTIEGLRLTGGDASGLGGHDWGSTPPNVGGGLYVLSATATISGNWILDSTAGDYADASSWGGGLGLVYAEVSLSGNWIGDNLAELGGGLWAYSSTLTLAGNTISGNLVESGANNGGGGLYLDESSADLTGNTISGNTSDNLGGGVYLYFSDQVTFSDNLIFSNTAIYGGGLYLNRSSPTIVGNRIEGNVGSHSGGGGNLERGSPVVSGNTISGNVAGKGGGLYTYYGSASLSDNDFLFNTANQGGGMYGSFGGGLTLSHNTFRNNTANYSGGGVYLFQRSPTLEGNGIVSNTAMRLGGGMALESSSAQFSGNTIWNNRVISGSGGGLHVHRGSPVLVNDVVAANQVLTSGAALYVEAAAPRLLHVTLADNLAAVDGSGLYAASYGDASMVVMSNTILVSHTVGVYAGLYSTVTLEGTLWGNGTDWAGDGLVLTGTVNVWGNPDFVYPDGGNYRIRFGSAARDAGVDAGVLVDIDGEARPEGAGFDIGADEWGPCDPLTGVEISGPVTGTVGGMAAFTATIEPPTATQPVAYVWQPEPEAGQGSANVTYVWREGGVVTVTVEAVNCGGGVSDAHLVGVSWPEPEPGQVVINEVAWSGTAASTNDEWLELRSLAGQTVDLDGCILDSDDGSPAIPLAGELAAGGYYLLERGDEQTVSDVAADVIYSGALENGGETLRLICGGVVDEVDGSLGWPGGTDGDGEPPYGSMERSESGEWYTNDGVHRNGLDANSQPINGTPGGGNSPYCPVPLAGVGLAGPVEGTVGVSYVFTATIVPTDATEPITYTWTPLPAMGAGAIVTYTWEVTGAQTITVMAENCSESVSATHVITISQPPPTCTGLVDVDLVGPVTGTVDTLYSFAAAITPTDATEPVTYTWWPVPTAGAGEIVTYTWDVTGVKRITATAENCGGVVSDTHTITVEAPPEPPPCYGLDGVEVSGPATGTVGAAYWFTATVEPGTASLPVTYTWEASEQGAVSGQQLAISYTWSTAGAKAITVTAENCGGSISDTYQVVIDERPPVTYSLYLPVVWREIPPVPVGDAPDDCPGYSAEAGRSYREDFDYQNDNDWFYFSVGAGKTYVVETVDLGPEANTYLYLWSGDCSVKLAEDDDGGEGFGSRIEWTATETGKLNVMVQSWDWQVYGPETGYTLVIEAVDGVR